MAKAKQSSGKIKKKRWFKIFAPKDFGETVIGESYVSDQQLLVGKCITANLMSLTGDMKKQNTNISFKVTALRPEGATTDLISYDIVPGAIKRLIKRGNKALSESFLLKTKDGVTIRIKPLVFTRTKSKGSVSTILRKAIKSCLTKKVASINYHDLINDLISYKIQRFIKDELNKIYPIRASEIRSMIKVDGEAKKDVEAKPEPEDVPKEQPKQEEVSKEKKTSEEEIKQKAKDIKETDAKQTLEKAQSA